MRVEITEERISDTDSETDPQNPRHYLQHRGDVITIPEGLGRKWCAYGWAKDVDGVHPTGERSAVAREPVTVAEDGTLRTVHTKQPLVLDENTGLLRAPANAPPTQVHDSVINRGGK
jgi:hypothetical protein